MVQDSCPTETDRRKHCELVIKLNSTFEEYRENQKTWQSEILAKLNFITNIGVTGLIAVIGSLFAIIGYLLRNIIHWG